MSHMSDIASLGRAGGELLPFAANLSRAKSRTQAFDLLASLARAMGFTHLTLTIENSGPSGLQRGPRWTTLEVAKLACLDANGFDGHDPVRRFARRASDPFIWSRGDWPGDRSRAARDIMASLQKASIEAGMTVTAWGRAGRRAIADAFGHEDQVRNLPAFAADILYLATAQTFRVIERLSAVQDIPPLTSREIEILELASQGLNMRSIAVRLQIVEPTVKFHFKGIRTKMNARNKAEAITRFAALGSSLLVVAAANNDKKFEKSTILNRENG
jgi:DNA-binding CsgD family transcriptional regulator